jgi:chemotaxis-related protein WspD
MNAPGQAPALGQEINSCWRRVGVWGDRTCPELATHVHCGNCPVFSAAGRGLLDQPAPEDYLREWAEVLGRPGEQHEETISALLFRLGPAWLALPAAMVVSITELGTPHHVPYRTGKIFTGLVNVAGELQLAFDLRTLFALPVEASPYVSLSCQVYPRLILCHRQGQSFAFAADEVHGAAALPLPQMQPIAATVNTALAVYTRGRFVFRKRPVLLLDDELLATALTRLQLA